MRDPKYIVIEGIDGTGKNTLAESLAVELDAVVIQEPCRASLAGELIYDTIARGDALESLPGLFLANRTEMHRNVLMPALREGRSVISVRSFISSLVYQQDYFPTEWLQTVNQFVRKPDLVLYLDLDPNIALSRIQNRDESPESCFETLDRLHSFRERYLKLLKRLSNVITLDATLSKERVLQNTLEGLCHA